MKLYYSPGACSLSPHIAFREAGLNVELVKVDMRSKKLGDAKEGDGASQGDFLAINPKGYVPALGLDDGSVLTEGPAIVQYLADQNPGANIAPPAGSIERYRLQEWLTFIGTELHKQYSPLFAPGTSDDVKEAQRKRIRNRAEFVNKHLEGREWLVGSHFTVADGYLFTVLRWSRFVGVDLEGLDNVAAFVERVGARPGVKAALEAEGIR